MDSIVRKVREIDAVQRRWIEEVVGHQLQDNQQVIIRVLDIGAEPDEQTRREALTRAADIARKGRANAAAQIVSEEELDAAIDEAIQHVRRRSD
jgi:hypothetical protein